MATTPDFESAGLYDPGADAAADRLELLQWLDAMGFSIDQMVNAHERSGLGAMASDQRLLPGPHMALDVAVERSGLDRREFEALATAVGFVISGSGSSRDLRLTDADVRTLVAFSGLKKAFSDDEAFGFLRVMGSSIERMAEAAVSLFLTDIESPHLSADGSEVELARKVFDAVGLLDGLLPLIDPIFRRHTLQAAERGRSAAISQVERLQYRYAVGFVDLVGFTPISQEMAPRELGPFIREFEGRAHSAITEAGGRLVKLIGDEVMFVAPSADSACRAANSLMSAFSTETRGDVVPRGGLAYGHVLVRGGDYYGEVVNLASRLVDEAVPLELLVSDAFADASTCLPFEPAGRRMLKGFADPIVVRSAHFWDRRG